MLFWCWFIYLLRWFLLGYLGCRLPYCLRLVFCNSCGGLCLNAFGFGLRLLVILDCADLGVLWCFVSLEFVGFVSFADC